MRLPPLLVLLAACTGTERELEPSPAEWIEATTVEGYEALTSVGSVPHRGTVRALNRYGAAVPSEAGDFTVDGTATSVPFDGIGYGGIVVETPGVVEVAGGSQPARLHAVAGGWPGASLHDAWSVPMPEPPQWTGALTNGMVSASGSEVWWAGRGAPPHRVLAADAPILGLRATHIDVDGVTDALVWTASTVYLLKGRAGGGMGWGGALRADKLGVGGADVGDLSGDNLPDVAIAWVDLDGSGLLDVWEGDGLFRFEAAEPRGIPGKPVDLVIGDNTGEGTPQITVVHQTASEWSRFVRGAPKQYIPIGPFMPVGAGVFTAGSTLLRTGDINDDGGDELTLVEPRLSGNVRDAYFFDLLTDVEGCASGVPGAQCTVQYLPVEQDIAQFMAVGDGNLDDVDDIWMLEETEARLYAIYWAPEIFDVTWQKVGLGPMPEYAPIDVYDVDSDGSPELHIAGATTWWRFNGHGITNDPERFWEFRPGASVQVREELVGPWARVELDGAPATIEAVGFSIDGGETMLKVLQYTVGGGRAPQIGQVVVASGGTTPDDLAVCGPNAWVVVAGQVHRVTVADPSSPGVAATTGTTASRVDCGAGPSGAAAAFLQDGDVVLVNNAGGEVGRVPASGAEDLALGDLGAGPVVETCTTPGCSVVFWPYGAAGEAVFARGDADGIRTVDAGGVETDIGGRGALSVGDLDGDGNLDLLGLHGPPHALLSVHRSTGASIAPLELWHSVRGIRAPLGVADGDGDGWPDLWAVDGDGNLKYTQPPTVETTTAPTTTGDTGLPPAPTGSTGDTGQ